MEHALAAAVWGHKVHVGMPPATHVPLKQRISQIFVAKHSTHFQTLQHPVLAVLYWVHFKICQ